jgi:hypothetical protein
MMLVGAILVVVARPTITQETAPPEIAHAVELPPAPAAKATEAVPAPTENVARPETPVPSKPRPSRKEPAATADAPPPVPPPPTTGTITFVGSVVDLVLADADGARHRAGELPAGRYTVLGKYVNSDEWRSFGDVTIVAGQDLQLTCNNMIGSCKTSR